MKQEHHSPHQPADDEQDDDRIFLPRGTLLFVMLMLIGYVIYWGYVWYLVVIERA